MNLLMSIREQMGKAVGAVVGGAFLMLCGALLAFVLSPQQALEGIVGAIFGRRRRSWR